MEKDNFEEFNYKKGEGANELLQTINVIEDEKKKISL